MRKCIDAAEICNDLNDDTKLNAQKRYNQTGFTNPDIEHKFEFFDTGHGLGYCAYETMCKNDMNVMSREPGGYSFLYFNVGDEVNLMKSDGSEIYFKPNEILIGSMRRDHVGCVHYNYGKFYKKQAILIDDALASEFEIFKNLKDENRGFSYKKSRINLSQSLILNELKSCVLYDGKMREIFIESKILEMIYKSFGAPNSCSLMQTDKKYALRAREILLQDIQNPPSIRRLAHMCGTNEFKLKAVFKEYFNTTIHAMLTNERLNAAKKLLQNGDINVGEAAKLVGYKNLSHFGKIFKAKFNTLPTRIRE